MLGSRFLSNLTRLFSTRQIPAPQKYSETFSRARNIMNLYDLNVYNEGFVFIAPNATVVGDVFMGSEIAIWHGTVIRGDINRVVYLLCDEDWSTILVSATTVCSTLPLLLQRGSVHSLLCWEIT